MRREEAAINVKASVRTHKEKFDVLLVLGATNELRRSLSQKLERLRAVLRSAHLEQVLHSTNICMYIRVNMYLIQ